MYQTLSKEDTFEHKEEDYIEEKDIQVNREICEIEAFGAIEGRNLDDVSINTPVSENYMPPPPLTSYKIPRLEIHTLFLILHHFNFISIVLIGFKSSVNPLSTSGNSPQL